MKRAGGPPPPDAEPKLRIGTLRHDFDRKVLQFVEQWLPTMRVALVLPLSVTKGSPCWFDITGKYPERWADRIARREDLRGWPKLSERIISFEAWSLTLPNHYDNGAPYVIVAEIVP